MMIGIEAAKLMRRIQNTKRQALEATSAYEWQSQEKFEILSFWGYSLLALVAWVVKEILQRAKTLASQKEKHARFRAAKFLCGCCARPKAERPRP